MCVRSSFCVWPVPLLLPIGTGPSLDLSKATKLKDVEFRHAQWNVQWVTAALKTIKSKNLQQITINLYPASVRTEEVAKWLDLDRLLIQFSTSHSIRPKITQVGTEDGTDFGALVLSLLPELSRRGVIDVVEL
jgi:hypothetical protein